VPRVPYRVGRSVARIPPRDFSAFPINRGGHTIVLSRRRRVRIAAAAAAAAAATHFMVISPARWRRRERKDRKAREKREENG